ncbi:MAG: nascent polypeptide-associated complex protein [Candidatus Korarchaeota archaeon]
MVHRVPVRRKKSVLREISSMMKDLQQEEINAKEVIFLTDTPFKIVSPKVIKIVVQGQETYQVIGTAEPLSDEDLKSLGRETPSSEVTISEDDVKIVALQAGVSEERAREALIQAEGDLARAILLLKQ